jgi:hypothetical protein
MRNLIFSFLLIIFIASCNKEPGKGGLASIQGKLYRIETNVLGQTLAEYYAADKDVFILYGDNDKIYDDKFSTSYDGSFKFDNLVKGSYTVFAYTKCDTCASQQDTIVKKTIEITDNKEAINIGDLTVYQ